MKCWISNFNFLFQNIQEIDVIRKMYQDLPILFIYISEHEPILTSESLTESEQHFLEQATNEIPGKKKINETKLNCKLLNIKNQLTRLSKF